MLEEEKERDMLEGKKERDKRREGVIETRFRRENVLDEKK